MGLINVLLTAFCLTFELSGFLNEILFIQLLKTIYAAKSSLFMVKYHLCMEFPDRKVI